MKLIFSVAFSLTLAGVAAVSPFSFSSSRPRPLLKLSAPLRSSPLLSPDPSKLASDLVSILGGASDAERIDPAEERELRSCLRFLAPRSPPRPSPMLGTRDLLSCDDEEEDEKVRWPPAAVMELARIAVDSGGDPAQIQRVLDPAKLQIPDVECAKEDRCELTRTPYGRPFINKELNEYFAFLFELIIKRAPLVGLNVSLSRYDLFHGHMFLATDSGRLGILFHAKEYPGYEKGLFPYNMGYCQTRSNMVYDDSMNLRNILWLAPLPSNLHKTWIAPGVLVVLDAHPGGIIYKDLVPDYADYVRTIYEDDFGELVADVNYFNVSSAAPQDRIFIC